MEKIIDIKPKTGGFSELASQMESTGFQATNLGKAVEVICEMKEKKATVFFAFTANLVASGLRGIIREMCEKKFIDVIITTAGSIDHDIIKCSHPYLKGSFEVDDVELHKKGMNRIGNIFVPTGGFEELERKMQEIYSEIYRKKKRIAPNELCSEIGKKLGKTSFLYWCSRNSIPVFCPGITDGAIGLQLYFFRQNHRDFCIDPGLDLEELGKIVLGAERTGAIVLGGGISKHHLMGANILRDGLDYAAYFSTAGEFDGSLSGAQTREAKSWGKLKERAKQANVNADATISFPIVIGALKEKKVL